MLTSGTRLGGTELATAGPKNVQQGVVLSPNDESVAFSRERNGWRRDLVRDVETSFGERFAGDGAWSSDGRRLISGFEGKLVLRDIGAGKEDELQVEGRNSKFVSDWSRDERFLIYTEVDAKTQADIWVLA